MKNQCFKFCTSDSVECTCIRTESNPIVEDVLKELEPQIIARANSLETIKDINCPRNVINPGLYLGMVIGVKMVLKYIIDGKLKESTEGSNGNKANQG